MTIYCDESGGRSAGVMSFAAAMLSPEAAADILVSFRAATGFRGELKGSRISLTERACLLDLFSHAGGRAWVAVAKREGFAQVSGSALASDLAVYAALLDLAVGRWLAETKSACTDVIIDDGRYDPDILENLRGTIEARLAGWGRASLADSIECDGLQIADVIANSLFNLMSNSQRAERIGELLEPLLAAGTIRVAELQQLS